MGSKFALLVGISSDTLIGIRNRALLVNDWACVLRCTGPSLMKRMYSTSISTSSLFASEHSKTGPRRQVIALPYGSSRSTCPVRSMQEWLTESGITSGPVFRRMNRHGNLNERLTAQSVRLIVKKNCQKAGLPGGICLRSGFCSTAGKAGKSEHQIMRQTTNKQSSSLQRISSMGLFSRILRLVG